MGFDGKVVGRRQRILRMLSYSRSTEREQFPKGARAESLAKHQVAAKAALQKSRSSSATEASSHEDTGVFRERCSFKQRPPGPFATLKPQPIGFRSSRAIVKAVSLRQAIRFQRSKVPYPKSDAAR